jgi:hypothetical protein
VALKKGAKMHSVGTTLIPTKDKKEIVFDNKIKMGSSFLMSARVISDEGLTM